MKISTVLDHIDSGHIALPEFQRGYVWNRDQVRGLFDSLYRRHPVGVRTDGRASRYEIEIQIQAELQDLVNDVTLWKDDRFIFRNQYAVDSNESESFDESIVAIVEISRVFARTVVATIMEGF